MSTYEECLRKASERANHGDHVGAIAYYQEACAKRWWCHQALMGLAGSYTWLGMFREAMQTFIRSAACFPQELPDYFVIKNRVRTHILAKNDQDLLTYVINALWALMRLLKFNFYAADFLADMLMLKGNRDRGLEKKYYAAICHAAFSKSEGLERFAPEGGKLPDFFIIGPQKTATTALYGHLTKSEDIYPAINKELFFFNGPMYGFGEHWYRGNFPCGADGNYLITGEATATYFHSPATPARMHALVPNAKLIFTLRHPAKRAISSFFMEKRHGREPRELHDAMKAEIDYIESHQLPPGGHPEGLLSGNRIGQGGYVLFGFYHHFIQSFEKFYPAHQISVVKAEDLRESVEPVLELCDFLDARRPSPERLTEQAHINVGRYEVGPQYERTFQLLTDYFRSRQALVGVYYDL